MSHNNHPVKPRLRRLNIRLSQQEWDKINKLCDNTTCRSVSEYARKVLSEKPVIMYYRNQSFDDFEEQMNRLLSQLESFGDNFSLMIKKISPLDNVLEIKSILPILLVCRQDFSITVEVIRTLIEKLSDHATQNNDLP